MNQFSFTFAGGRIIDNVTSVVLVNNTTKTIDISVPTGKRWILQFIKVVNPDDVNRTVTITLYKEVAKTNVLAPLGSVTISATATGIWPHDGWTTGIDELERLMSGDMLLLEAANTISVVWTTGGASTGATDADGLVVKVREVDK